MCAHAYCISKHICNPRYTRFSFLMCRNFTVVHFILRSVVNVRSFLLHLDVCGLVRGHPIVSCLCCVFKDEVVAFGVSVSKLPPSCLVLSVGSPIPFDLDYYSFR